MYDIECPYCNAELEVNHDDGFGYDEDVDYEMQCSKCDKYFTFTTSIHYYYHPKKADCLNGSEHNLEPVTHFPKRWPDWKRCRDCSYEERGKPIPVVL